MLSHLDENYKPHMVNVSDKQLTYRVARAQCLVSLPPEVTRCLQDGEIKTAKGPVFSTAIIAGTMAVKKTADLIPLCHSLPIDSCRFDINFNSASEVFILCEVRTYAKTGVEMEALTGASVAGLTIYDMCKALSHHIQIGDIKLLKKTGGKHDFSVGSPKPELYGLILAGGKSQRMGQDKALLNYHGMSQLQQCHELLTKCCRHVFLSTRENQFSQQETNHIPQIYDIFPHSGPLGGILSAMHQYPTVAWLVIACDLPFLDADTLDDLLSQRNPYALATLYQNDDQTLEPLCAIYEPNIQKNLSAGKAQGINCPRKILNALPLKTLKLKNANALTNVNDRTHYQRVMEQTL